MDDYPVNALTMQHTTDYVRDGTTEKRVVYRFYLGKHGPFTGKFAETDPQPSTVNAYIEQLRAQLRGIVT